jgi:hypothetical protein
MEETIIMPLIILITRRRIITHQDSQDSMHTHRVFPNNNNQDLSLD